MIRIENELEYNTEITGQQQYWADITVTTVSRVSLLWAADKQNLARASMIDVAGNPTTTMAIPRSRHSRLNALKTHTHVTLLMQHC